MPSIPQRTVSLSIITSSGSPKVYYTYVNPITKKQFKDVPTCDLVVNQPVYTLFYLDYESTDAGWTISDIKPAGDSAPIAWKLGPHELSATTDYPFHAPSKTYRFYICYQNAKGPSFCEDPQEGNGPPSSGTADR